MDYLRCRLLTTRFTPKIPLFSAIPTAGTLFISFSISAKMAGAPRRRILLFSEVSIIVVSVCKSINNFLREKERAQEKKGEGGTERFFAFPPLPCLK
jgi:hypothetical protein